MMYLLPAIVVTNVRASLSTASGSVQETRYQRVETRKLNDKILQPN